jgi:hypothetical protein
MLIPLAIVFCGKAVIDFLTIRTGAKLFKQKISIPHFLIAEILHVPYIVIAAAVGQIASLRWKGRNI